MIKKTLADKLAKIAVKQIRAGMGYKEKRMKKIATMEAQYIIDAADANKLIPGRYDIRLPIVGGFIDTLRAFWKQQVNIRFEKTDEADYTAANLVSAKWRQDSSPQRGKWRLKDMRGNFLAAFSGVKIFDIHAESDPQYRSILRNVNHHYFYCQPKKGPDLEEHMYLGEVNFWKTKHSLRKGAKSGLYDADQVNELISNTKDEQHQMNQEIFAKENEKLKALGLDDKENYFGEDIFCMTRHFMEYHGKRYYLFLDYNTGTWIRAELLEDMIEEWPDELNQPLWPYVASHTHEDPFEFWNKAPADDIYPISETMRAVASLALENLRKRTRTKRAVDASLFPDISEIEDDVTEVVETNTVLEGKSVGQGVYEFKTEDNTQIIVNLTNWMNSMLGEHTGITPGAKGGAQEDKATIYVGNMQRVATRMSLQNDYWKQGYVDLGVRYQMELIDKLTEGQYVKYLGAKGYQWEELTKDKIRPVRDFDLSIIADDDDSEMGIQKNKQKLDSLLLAAKFKPLNPDFVSENILRIGGWEDEDIKSAQDTDLYGDRKLLSEAAIAIEKICNGEEPKLNRRANEAFIMKIIEFADDNEENLDKEGNAFERLYAYAYMHLETVAKNAARRAMILTSSNPAINPLAGLGGQAPQQQSGNGPIPASPENGPAPAPIQVNA